MFTRLATSALPGVGLGNIIQSMTFLTASNRKGLGDSVPEFESGAREREGQACCCIWAAVIRRWIVFAPPCARARNRSNASTGAIEPTCRARSAKCSMPQEEGVEFVWLTAPEAYLGDDVFVVCGAVRIRLGAPDATGRQTPENCRGSSHEIEADLVIKALGFDPEDLPNAFRRTRSSVTGWGTVGDRLPLADDQPRRGVCGRGHRARRVAGRLGCARWARCRGINPFLLQEQMRAEPTSRRDSETGGSSDQGKAKASRRRVRQSVADNAALVSSDGLYIRPTNTTPAGSVCGGVDGRPQREVVTAGIDALKGRLASWRGRR